MAKDKNFGDATVGSVLAEYVGTFSLAFAVLASINGVLSLTIPTQAIAGFTLFLAVLSIGGISGAHINPAVTLGLLSLRKIETEKAVAYIVSQLAGAFSAGALMSLMLDDVLTATAGEADWRIFLAETIGMFLFTFGIAAAVYNKYDGINAAALVGGSLFIGTTVASIASNGVLNPAVALAIDSINIAYIFAPIIGAVLGMHLYAYMHKEHQR